MKDLTDADKNIVLGDLFQYCDGSWVWQPARHVCWHPVLGAKLSDGSWVTVDEATAAFAELNV